MSAPEVWTPDRFITWLGHAGIELVRVDTNGSTTVEVRAHGDESNPVFVAEVGQLRKLAHTIYREHRRANQWDCSTS